MLRAPVPVRVRTGDGPGLGAAGDEQATVVQQRVAGAEMSLGGMPGGVSPVTVVIACVAQSNRRVWSTSPAALSDPVCWSPPK